MGENKELDFAFKNMYSLKSEVDYFLLSKTYGLIIFLKNQYDSLDLKSYNIKLTTAFIGIRICKKKHKMFNFHIKPIYIKKTSSFQV